MSQNHHDKDRREFIRQSLGVAPLMLTLGGRSHHGNTSMHGTLWSSLGTKWKHKKKWWGWNDRSWRWSKKSGDKYRGRDDHRRRTYDDYKKDERPARKDWDWDKSEERWRKELEAEKKRQEIEAERRRYDRHTETDRSYDWRNDNAWKRSEGLSPFSSKSDHKKD